MSGERIGCPWGR
jgi:hypothetical protein